MAEDYWVECKYCHNKLYGCVQAKYINKLNILCIKQDTMKIYYARPISLYNTKQEERDLLLLTQLSLDVVNPNKEELQQRYQSEGMDVFTQAVSDCDALAFRSFQDGNISAGVKKEIDKAIELGKPVIELPTITSQRVLSVDDTRKYLELLGSR